MLPFYQSWIDYVVPATPASRRRLWGGDYPTNMVGTNIRLFGGHNYGYVIPRYGLDQMMQTLGRPGDPTYFVRTLTAGSWAVFGVGLAGVLACGIVPTLKVLAACFAFQEVWSLLLSQMAEGISKFDDGAVASVGLTPGFTRGVSGISMVFNLMAGWLCYYGDKGWMPWQAGWLVGASNLQAMYKLPTLYTTHIFHWGSFALGYYLFSYIQPDTVFKPGFLAAVLFILATGLATALIVLKFAPVTNMNPTPTAETEQLNLFKSNMKQLSQVFKK